METLKSKGLVATHYIIPKKFRNHYVMNKLKYNVDAKYNKVYLPTIFSRNKLKLNNRRNFSHQIHDELYEDYVEEKLDYTEDIYELDSLVGVLSNILKFEIGTVPPVKTQKLINQMKRESQKEN